MEANEAQELHEQAEHAEHDAGLRLVAFTMSVLAVMVAVTTVLGHRTHTEAVLKQNQATDKWNEYATRKIRSNDTKLASDLLSVIVVADKEKAGKKLEDYEEKQRKWEKELEDTQNEAKALESEVNEAEARADRFDLGEALQEIGLVISSVTLLTKKKLYWYFGLGFALAGLASALSVLWPGVR